MNTTKPPNIEISVTSFKCFQNKTDFPPIASCNLIVGRNNVGKSTLLQCIQAAFSNDNNTRNSIGELTLQLDVPNSFGEEENGFMPGSNHRIEDHRHRFKNAKALFVWKNQSWQLKNVLFREDVDEPIRIAIREYFSTKRMDFLTSSLIEGSSWSWQSIAAERDIEPETSLEDHSTLKMIRGDGRGITAAFEYFLNSQQYSRTDLIEGPFIQSLNEIFLPEICFKNIRVKRRQHSWELVLETKNGSSYPLKDMGSGLKTVLLVLFKMLFYPEIRRLFGFERFVFAFEELENNLHPATLRRLFQFIRKRNDELGSILFITTHSHVVVDIMSKWEEASLIHVRNDSGHPELTQFTSEKGAIEILDDLGARASDLFLSNANIWVEGPSDAILLERWLELASKGQLRRGVEYTFVFYGGTNQKHLGFSPDVRSKLISAFRLCHCNIFLADSNKASASHPPQEGAIEVANQIFPPSISWITQGREIENYLHDELVRRFFRITVPFDAYTDLYEEERIQRGSAKEMDKVKLARQVVSSIQEQHLDVLDLRAQLAKVVNAICHANGIAFSSI